MVEYIDVYKLMSSVKDDFNKFCLRMQEEHVFIMENYKIYFFKQKYCYKVQVLDEKKFMLMKLKYGF
jgi:hypothetical protein